MKGYIKISSESHGGPLCVECKAMMNGFSDPCNVVDAVLEAVSRTPEAKEKILSAVTANMIIESVTGESNSQKIVYPETKDTKDDGAPLVGFDKDLLDLLLHRGRDDG